MLEKPKVNEWNVFVGIYFIERIIEAGIIVSRHFWFTIEFLLLSQITLDRHLF